MENGLNEYILFHNNSKKSSTKFSPKDIRDITDKNIIEIIINNILHNLKKHKLDKNEILGVDEKLIFWSCTILKNDIYIRNPNDKNGNYIFPWLFKEYINSETIKVKFLTNINKNFKDVKEINGNISCFIIMPEFVFNGDEINMEYYMIYNKVCKINKNNDKNGILS